MKYQLLGKNSLSLYDILENRKITNAREYLNLTKDVINDYNLLGLDNLKNASIILLSAIQKGQSAVITIDCDADGFCSSAIFINYLWHYFPQWVENNLHFFLHEGKVHGLEDCYQSFIDNKYNLVICPDSASNDYEYHKSLDEHNIKVIILDHHSAEKVSPYKNTVTINNQLSDYPNKDFCGGGIVWQFCRFLNDTLFHDDYYLKFLDLVSLANISDMMSMTSFETTYLIREGLKEENIKNPFISYMREKNAYSIGPISTPIGWAFYITPFVNAIVRSGTMEEKELIFNSFLEYKAFQEIPSTKRGCKGQIEKLVEQATRTATNVKARQTKLQDAGMAFLESQIEKNKLLDHKVILFLLEKEEIPPSLAGLCANKIMAKYQRPVCVLTKHIEQGIPWESEKEQIITYSGSARGCEIVGATRFREVCESFEGTCYAQGHSAAFGLCLQAEKIKEFLDYTDEVYKDISDEAVYHVDFICNYGDLLADTCTLSKEIMEVGDREDLWGQDIMEPYIVIEDVSVTPNMVAIYEKRDDTLKIQLSPNISAMKFKISTVEKQLFRDIPENGSITITIVGKCRLNNFNGNSSAQIEITDFDLLTTKKYDF